MVEPAVLSLTMHPVWQCIPINGLAVNPLMTRSHDIPPSDLHCGIWGLSNLAQCTLCHHQSKDRLISTWGMHWSWEKQSSSLTWQGHSLATSWSDLCLEIPSDHFLFLRHERRHSDVLFQGLLLLHQTGQVSYLYAQPLGQVLPLILSFILCLLLGNPHQNLILALFL